MYTILEDKGPVRKDGDTVEIDTFAFLTAKPNEFVASIHPSRMPVMLVGEDAQSGWLAGTVDEALGLVRSYPADKMEIVQRGVEKADEGARVWSATYASPKDPPGSNTG